MDWKSLQNPMFQVLYSVISRDDRPPPLQIRSFTSESYKAIKERERRKSVRREENSTEQRSTVWKKEDTCASADAVTMQEIKRMDSGPHDVVLATNSGAFRTEPLVIQDGGRIQEDDEFQHKLSSPTTAPVNPSIGEIQCLAAPASPAMSPQERGLNSEVYTGARQERRDNRVPDLHTASLDEVDIMAADVHDAGTFDQQPHIQTRNDTELAVASSSYPTPVDRRAGGPSDPCGQLIESCGNGSPSPSSHSPNSAAVVAAATGLAWLPSTLVADGALAHMLPDEPSYTVGVARTVGSPTNQARSERAGWIDCKSMPPGTWTIGRDEQLLHLRDIAQLNWRNIVSYFPGMTMDAIKGHYKHLSASRMVCQTVGEEPKPQVQMRKRTTYLTSSTSQKAVKQCRAPSKTKLRKHPISLLPEHRGTPSRRHGTKRAKPTKYVASLAAATDEDACQRTSRCGRTIRHPYRHLASEGYF